MSAADNKPLPGLVHPSWARWEWLHRALHNVYPMSLRWRLRVVHLRIVQVDRVLTTPRRFPWSSGSRVGTLGSRRSHGSSSGA